MDYSDTIKTISLKSVLSNCQLGSITGVENQLGGLLSLTQNSGNKIENIQNALHVVGANILFYKTSIVSHTYTYSCVYWFAM